MAAAFESMEGEGYPKDLTHMQGRVTIRNVVGRLRKTYYDTDTIGLEYMHIDLT